MAKVKLKVKHIIDDVIDEYIVYAIKSNNKYFYSHNENKFDIIKKEDEVHIKVTNSIIHEIFFRKINSYGIIDKKYSYKIKLINLKILDKIIEIDYKVDSVNKFVLEEVYD